MANEKEQTLNFIEDYKYLECLWNPNHKHYQNKIKRIEALKELGNKNHLSINAVKNKIKCLRSYFSKEYNKTCKSSSFDDDDKYVSSWFAYKALMFIRDADATDYLETETTQFFNNSATYIEQPVSDHQYTGRNSSTDRTTRLPRPSASQTNHERNRERNHERNPNNVSSDFIYAKRQMDEAVTYLKTTAGEKKEMDEYDLYGQLLVKKLRKLDEHQRDVAMHEIDNIMFNAKLQSNSTQAQRRSYSTSPVPRKMKSPLFVVTQPNQQFVDDSIVEVYQQDPMQTQSPT